MSNPPEISRKRLSVDLTPYPEVVRMLQRFERENLGVSRTHIVITAIREWGVKNGLARKKDLQP